MREIKFRAWEARTTDEYGDTYGGEMHYTDQEHTKRRFEVAGFYLDSGFNETDFILMQFTGLHDKNGKEIYEGDVVKARGFQPELHIVRFDRGAFCLEPITGIDSNFWSDIKYVEDEHGEVIGNIYENPELIEK